MVPKSLYRTAEELESEEHRLLSDSIYKSASIFKGAPYEVKYKHLNEVIRKLCTCNPPLYCVCSLYSG